MKTLLFNLNFFVCGLSLLGIMASANAQQKMQRLQKRTNQKGAKAHNQGQKLYKMAKLFDQTNKVPQVGDNANEREGYFYEVLRNPNTGVIPADIRDREINFSKKIPEGNDLKQSISSKSAKAGNFSYWKSRGPFNLGGRTRALAIDRTNENVIIAGGVSGGVWRSTNGGQSWRKVTNRRQSPSITCIVQDPRPGKHNIWYYGSGERRGNSASAGRAFYAGTGVYKSTDGGRTWKVLEATNDGNILDSPFNIVNPFDIINSIVVNPMNGDVYVATTYGVYRTKDEGNSFSRILETGEDAISEISITSTGRIYAAVADYGEINTGFFTSIDRGDTWINITPPDFMTDFGRSTIGIDPSNENTVYFLTVDYVSNNVASLNRYNATENTWTDLTANLPPNIGTTGGEFSLLRGYSMLVKVSPTDSNTVFVGGTNLYRSTDGFTTPVGIESWIGGYRPVGIEYEWYTNQHPDQHDLIFYPSNPNKALSANDGGVYVTEDITAVNTGVEPVAWTSLNNGYITTQPHHMSIDPRANIDDMLVGFQDNGTWFTNSTDGKVSWIKDYSGDGSFSAIADAGRTRYVSAQRGSIFRFNFDEAGALESYARVTPAGASGFQFIAPFVLDSNNDNIMYLPAGNRIWRNNDLDELPLSSIENTTVNWVNLSNSATPSGSSITSLDVSKYPVANRLYYGTNRGGIYRMDNANIDEQEVIDISTGKGLPEAGFVYDINVDESNSDRVIVTFSNYGIPSLFLTENGGDTWVNISGNLEENADGTGNGPSVRNTAFLGSSQGLFGSKLQKVFAATSTGLYYTNRINGEKTRWRKEPFVIGNAVTDVVKTRKDGFVGVSAHGNGVYSARFPLFNELPESTLSVSYFLDDVRSIVSDSIETFEVDVTDLFVSSTGAPIDIEFTNSNPELVSAALEDNTISITIVPDSIGEATIGLVATSQGEQVAEGFTISVKETPVYDQNGIPTTQTTSQFFTDFDALVQAADDFTIPEGSSWSIERVLAFGNSTNSPALTNATIVIYEDDQGIPGEEIYNSGQIVPISDSGDANMNLMLPEEITLKSGNYWLSVYANESFSPGRKRWYWAARNVVIGKEAQSKDESDLFGDGAVDWTPAGVLIEEPPIDQVFQIFGSVGGASVENTKPLAQIDTAINSSVFPNPSTNIFNFNLKDFNLESSTKSNEIVMISVYDISGTLVHQESAGLSNMSWNASNRPSGVYFVEIKGPNTNKRYKLIKK